MEFRIATSCDDEAIRQLLRQIPLQGMLKLRYQREPSYFNSVDIQGTPNQTVVGLVDGKVMAVASQNLQMVYINGDEKTAGYISNLRFHPDIRNGHSLIKGIRFFEEMSASFPVDFHFATLIEKESNVQNILTANRPRMPKVFDYGKVFTYAIPLRKTKTAANNKSFKIIQANEQLIPGIFDFLDREGKQRNLFPVLNKNSYDSKFMESTNFFVAYENDEIVGLCSVNDSSGYKQYILEDYSPAFGLARIPFNWFLSLKQLHPIPTKGEQIKMLTVGFPIVKNNRNDVFKCLIDHIYASFAASGFHFLTLALHENNPLNKSLKSISKIKYTSRLYIVKLKNDKFVPGDLNLEQNIPFIDLPRY